jgi:hypothetical protein
MSVSYIIKTKHDLNPIDCGHNQYKNNWSRGNYPYFFRMLQSNDMAYLKLLLLLNVNRVAVIYGPNNNNTGVDLEDRKSLRDLFRKNGISIVASLTVSYEFRDRFERDSVYGTLKSADARYIIMKSAPFTIAQIYFTAKNYSMLSSKYVWMGDYIPSSGSIGTLEDCKLFFVF